MGLDEIHPWILKELAEEGTKTLPTMFEKWWQYGNVPIVWKRETIAHILKRVCKDGMGNRPVSPNYVSGPFIGQMLLENTEVHKKNN